MSGGALHRIRWPGAALGAAMAVASMAACTAPPPAPAAVAASAPPVPFGNENVVYRDGPWRIYFPNKADYPEGNGAAIVVWLEGRNLAVEVIGANTYWTLRRGSSVTTVTYRLGTRAIDPVPRPMPLGSPTASQIDMAVAANVGGRAVGPLTADISTGTPPRYTRITASANDILIVFPGDPYHAGGPAKLLIPTDRESVAFSDEFGALHSLP
jgi:hypothetical protein